MTRKLADKDTFFFFFAGEMHKNKKKKNDILFELNHSFPKGKNLCDSKISSKV